MYYRDKQERPTSMFRHFIQQAVDLVSQIAKLYRGYKYDSLSFKLASKPLYTIMSDFSKFVKQMLSTNQSTTILESEYVCILDKYHHILTKHDVYIVLAAYRESGNSIVRIFIDKEDKSYKRVGPYLPLANFLSQLDDEFLSSFYGVDVSILFFILLFDIYCTGRKQNSHKTDPHQFRRTSKNHKVFIC